MYAASQPLATTKDASNAARDAALKGARQAFSRPSSAASRPQQQSVAAIQPQLRSSRNKTPPPLPRKSSTSVRIPASAIKAQAERATTTAVGPSASSQAASPSPSNIAAGTTVFRTSQAARQTPKIETSPTESIRHELSRLASPAWEDPQTQRYPSSSASASISHPKKPSKPPPLEGRNLRPKLKIDPSTTTAPKALIQSHTTSPEIHSPQPVRPTSSATAFKAATQQLQYEAQGRDGTLDTSDELLRNSQVPFPREALQVARNGTFSPPAQLDTEEASRSSQAANLQKASHSTLLSSSDNSDQRIEALANAIVASHLASSRASSPAKSPLPQSRTGDKLHHNFHPLRNTKAESRTPSPAKRMRQTLRKPPAPDTDDEQNMPKARGHFHLRQHPNKHHEGDRRRWRDEITYEERKRYEGMWAANRNLHARYTDAELRSPQALERAKDDVSGLVVKDIWARSRLPTSVLEEIWDLVDRRQLGRLDREEFVVGLWLIDQRLKGRKLPTKVGSSVWQSVRGIYGLKVPKRID